MRKRRWIILVILAALALLLVFLFLRKGPQSSTGDAIKQPDSGEIELPLDRIPSEDSAGSTSDDTVGDTPDGKKKPSEKPDVNGGDSNTPDVGGKPEVPDDKGDNKESSDTPGGGSEGTSRDPIVLPEIELD